MYKGTNPTVILLFEGIDLTNQTVQVSLRLSNGETMIRATPEIGVSVTDGNSLVFIPFTQAETLQLPAGVCQVQLRCIDSVGNARVSEPAALDILGILTDNIIEYQREDEQ